MLELNTSQISLFFDFINFLIIFLFIFIIFKNNLINKLGFLILILFSLTPFFGNDIIWDYSVFPDQSKYLINSKLIRENYFSIISEIFFGKWEIFHSRFQVALGDQFIPTRYASLIIASTPIPFIETVRSLSFFSKFIFIAWFTYLIFYQRKHHENKNENYYYYLLLLSPSILMYTSVGLKEAYIFVFFHLCMFSVLYRKLFLFLISIGILSLLRYEMIFLIGVFSIFYIFIFYYYPEEKVSKKIQNLLKGLIILSILFFLIIFINDLFFLKEYLNLFIETINKMKLGYHMEGDLISELRLYSYDSNFSIIPMIYDGLNAILSPTFSKSPNIFLYLLVIENFLIISLFILYIFALAKLNLLKSIFYIIIFLIFNLSVGILVINDMAIYRYKITMIIPLLLILREEVLSYKNENIIFDKS